MKNIEDYRLEDCIRIQTLYARHHQVFPLAVCQAIWEYESEKWAARWLFLPESDKDLWNCLKEYL